MSLPPPPPLEGMPAHSSADGELAGFWRRLAGAFMDGIVTNIVAGIVIAIVGKSQGSSAGSLIGLVIGLGYAILLIGRPQGQTFGMQLMGIRVVAIGTGEPIGYGRAIGRAVMSIVSALAILLGYIWMIWDKDKQTWHDKVASSVVVRV